MAKNISSAHPWENSYASIFHSYINRSVEESIEQVRTAQPLVSDDVRVQAWHVLDYGLAETQSWPATRELLMTLAPKMEQAGFRDEWIAFLERGMKSSESTRDHLAQIEICIHAGYLYYLRSDFDAAKEWLNLGLNLYQRVGGSDELHAKLLNRLAFVARRQQDTRVAEAFAKRVLFLPDVADSERANSYYILGELAFRNRELEDSERYLWKSLALWQVPGDKRKIAWGLRNLGPVLFEQGKVKKAIKLIEEAITIFKEIQDTFHLAITQMNLGIVYTHAGDLQGAIKLFALAEPIFIETQSSLFLAKVYQNQGMVFRKAKEWSRAENAYRQSIELWWRLQNKSSELNSMDGLGMVFTEQGRYREAAEQFQKALDELHQLERGPSWQLLYSELTAHLDMVQKQLYEMA